jgi:F-type H+-transporting ATPase subunit gamma
MLGATLANAWGAAGLIAAGQQARNYATLKDLSIRLKSVKNIQKITKSMKMIAAVKYARSERELKPARPYGEGAQVFYERTELAKAEKKPQNLLVLISSDRGLCGAIHSSIARMVRHDLNDVSEDYKVVVVGDKARGMLQKQFGKNFLFAVTQVGKRPPTFEDATNIAQGILESGYTFNQGDIYYNKFRSVVSYKTTKMPFFNTPVVAGSEKMGVYDSIDADVVQSYVEYSLASLIYYALKESNTSEQSSRMTSMDAATKNAGEMIDKMTLLFNRTRQAVITKELIEIISGAAAL